ncbi:MAG: CDP-diacylglycerol--glycerol-3-phosphate 3-phosphatidyltransferase [Candidatus Izimaplasma sp.]|nr:CDP-diacylglycerol--glycerol-3-phosphate 3-phosphatidyltransferase [Candidatus Izimaplasma bacterium]
MNLPNKLSFMRVLLVPVLVIIYYLNIELGLMFLAPIFVVASLTDFLDGYIARKHNLVTTFGKFIDPLADKLLVMATLLLLNDAGIVPMWITIIIMSREFIVTGIRLITVGEGKVIAASKLGKIKTASTMIALILLLMYPYANIFAEIGLYILYIGLAFTIISLFDYYLKNRKIIMESI